jgi:peptidoglycan/xylan/chitin deacetylase (PgdA/CDA1 family)
MAILAYHHIGACPPGQEASHRGLWVTPELFGQQLAALRDGGWRCVTLDAVGAALAGGAPLPRKWVAITFDDGWLDNLTAALPVLRDHGFSATVFMITARTRQGAPANRWDDCLSADELREWRDAGMSVGSHTHTHPKLSKLNDGDARRELQLSREALEEVLGAAPAWLAYPYGYHSQRVARLARAEGYAGAVSTIRDNRVRPEQLYALPRVMVMHDTTPRRLRYMMSGMYHLVHAWKNRHRWKERA